MKYYKLVENARKPGGFWGRMMIRSMNKGHYALTGWALEHIKTEQNFKILDVGCGGGRTVARLSKIAEDGRVYGIDYSELAVKKSKNYNKRDVKNGKVTIDRGSVSVLPYSDGEFDLVTAVETYYFWPDKINDLKEINRVTKPGGCVLLVFEMCRTQDDPEKWIEVENIAGIKAVSEEEIAENLTAAGFRDVKTYTKDGTAWLCAVGRREQI